MSIEQEIKCRVCVYGFHNYGSVRWGGKQRHLFGCNLGQFSLTPNVDILRLACPSFKQRENGVNWTVEDFEKIISNKK